MVVAGLRVPLRAPTRSEFVRLLLNTKLSPQYERQYEWCNTTTSGNVDDSQNPWTIVS